MVRMSKPVLSQFEYERLLSTCSWNPAAFLTPLILPILLQAWDAGSNPKNRRNLATDPDKYYGAVRNVSGMEAPGRDMLPSQHARPLHLASETTACTLTPKPYSPQPGTFET